MNRIKTVIFDLDGTLIDSSRSILAGFESAFLQEGISPVLRLGPEIIGPPLKETLSRLAGQSDPPLIERLAERFKEHYDSIGYRETIVFPGVDAMLRALCAMSIDLHIATNKRLCPTLKIVEYLGWTPFFGKIRALDSSSPPAASKAATLRRLLDEFPEGGSCPLYVGDRAEDFDAATANQMPFAFASWGYGDPELAHASLVLSSPEELVTAVLTAND